MGLLSGILSPALTTATQAAGAYQGAQANAAVTQRDAQLNALMTLRQQKQFESQMALQKAQTAQEESKAQLNTREANTPRLGDDNYASSMGAVEQAKALATLPTQIQLMVLRGQIDRGTALALASVNHQNRLSELGSEYGYKGNLQSQQQNFERGLVTPRAQAGAQAAQTTQQYKEGGEIIPSIVRPINNLVRDLVGAKPAGAPSPAAPASPASTRQTITPAERAALIQQGFNPADIDAKYDTQTGPSGGGSSF